jgi:hypothetical protein
LGLKDVKVLFGKTDNDTALQSMNNKISVTSYHTEKSYIDEKWRKR